MAEEIRKNPSGIEELLANVRQKRPLIHCITHPISINQCANAILALGARPMMAEHPGEVETITKSAGALMLNLGNLSPERAASIPISANAAKEAGVKVCLDVCGAACLENRRGLALNVIGKYAPDVVKGNYSEIMALARGDYSSSGVDADAGLNEEEILKVASELADKYGVTILASGKVDIICDGHRSCLVRNGCEQMGMVTGTGCLQGAIAATFLSCRLGFDAAVDAALVLGVCGELANESSGGIFAKMAGRRGTSPKKAVPLGTFAVNLMDSISTVTAKDITKKADIAYIART
ncbi:MAG: hydroxyethylthiazole kinase [Lachnospiraceae bacterium]|nr:hydroxyethylthiazole kinase [Lachnospiraceae bacterium]